MGEHAPVMGGEPYPETQVDARTSVYGPGVTEARGLEVATLMHSHGALLEQLACSRALPIDCVIVGRDAWATALVMGLPCDTVIWGSVVVAVVDRRELRERLDALGRHGDAAKVLKGPPDAPTPGPDPRARLLVTCADTDCLAVTWSQSWQSAPAPEGF